MPYGMYISAEGAQAQAQRLQVIANNLANVETAGFKRDVATFQARFAEAIQQGDDYPGSRARERPRRRREDHRHARPTSPPARSADTGIPTDFAINGDGFFQVRGGDGGVYLTRAGNFTLDAAGPAASRRRRPAGARRRRRGEIIDRRLAAVGSACPAAASCRTAPRRPSAWCSPQSLGDLVKVGDNLFRPLGPDAPVRRARARHPPGLPRTIGRQPDARDDGDDRNDARVRSQHASSFNTRTA